VSRRTALVLTFLAAYLLSYFFRSTNAVLAGDLQRDAGLGPEQLGFMTSLFFLVFAAAQLPLGAALDRWGPRWVPAGLMLIAAAGSLVTAAADGFAGLASAAP
jgi:sugar phosphate permease